MIVKLLISYACSNWARCVVRALDTNLEITHKGKKRFGHFFLPSFDHLASAAFRALALRSSGVSFAALLLPPFAPPIFPRATAFGFFSRIDD